MAFYKEDYLVIVIESCYSEIIVDAPSSVMLTLIMLAASSPSP
jgi:hypothetical protein